MGAKLLTCETLEDEVVPRGGLRTYGYSYEASEDTPIRTILVILHTFDTRGETGSAGF